MVGLPQKSPFEDQLVLVSIAREIAMDIYDLPAILQRHNISQETFEKIKLSKHFNDILTAELAVWASSLNTNERVKIKAAVQLEEWLPELHGLMHKESESLAAKIEGGKLIARLAGLGLNGAAVNGGNGEQISITINLGEDRKLEYKRELPSQVIEHEPQPE